MKIISSGVLFLFGFSFVLCISCQYYATL